MNSQSHSTTLPKPEESTSASSQGRRRLIKIRRSSGKYEYVTREQLKELEQQREQRRKIKKTRKKIISFSSLAAVAVLMIFVAYWFFKPPSQQLHPKPNNASLIHPETSPNQTNATGAIRVLCNEDGATVYVDGKPLKQTKRGLAIVSGIEEGVHEVKLEKHGYWISPKYVNIEITPNQASELRFILSKAENALVSMSGSGELNSPTNSHSIGNAGVSQSPSRSERPHPRPSSPPVQPPIVTILSGPDEVTNHNPVEFSWEATERARFSTFLEGHDQSYSKFVLDTKTRYSNLPDGKYTFHIRAKNTADNAMSEVVYQTFVIDTTPPMVQLVEGPNGTVGHKDVTFEFSAQEPATFSSYLDGVERNYSSYGRDGARNYHNLADGNYTFYLKARDMLGNEISNPLVRRFTVDTVAPGALITLKPNPVVSYNTVTFAFTSKKTAQFSYYVEGWDKGFSPYTDATEVTYTDLPDGKYAFYLRAKDEFDNIDATPTAAEFTVDTTPPTVEITRKPPSIVTYGTVSFDFDANENSSFSFYLEGYDRTYSDYTSEVSKTYRHLSDGEYIFYVRAKDAAGNVQPTPTSHSFTVKTTEVIFEEDFEGKELVIKAGDFNPKNGRDFWGKSKVRVKSGQFSLWCSGQGDQTKNYDKNMQAWYEIKVDLSYYSHSTLTLWYYLDTTNDILDQFILRAAPLARATPNSHNGFKVLWVAPPLEGQSSIWVKATVPLDKMIGQSAVLRLCFDSDRDQQDEGVYIDGLQIMCKY
ncbi:hypothetical protein IH992_06815 [Candidatus Poribacteria bacterium]|nr:hypothetical protein [Candidatus Poribacteria bacterium]